MIRLTRLNGKDYVLNSDLIKAIEATPDTVITLTDGDKLMVKESVEDVVQRTTSFRRGLFRDLFEGKAPLRRGSENELGNSEER